MDYKRHLDTVKDGWKVIVLLCTLFLLAGLGVNLVLPPRYIAQAALVVEPQRVDPFTGVALPAPLFSQLPTELDILRSERVALQVVNTLGLQDDAGWKKKWQVATGGRGSYPSWLASQIVRPLSVHPTRESNVLALSYASADPAHSAQMANAFARAYVAVSLQLRQEPARRYSSYFNETSRRLRANLEQAQQKLSSFQQEHGIVSVDERLDVENARLSQLSAQLVTLQAAAASAAGRERQARSGAIAASDIQRDVSAEIARQESRLGEMRSRLGDSHPTVEELRHGLEALRERLRAERQRALTMVQGESRVAAGEVATATAALDVQRSKVLALNTLRDQARVLQREVDNAQRAFETVLARSNESTLEGGASAGNVSVLNEAAIPATPQWPRRLLVIAVAAVAGVVAGAALVLLRERREPRLRTIEDVQTYLQQRVLLSLEFQR